MIACVVRESGLRGLRGLRGLSRNMSLRTEISLGFRIGWFRIKRLNRYLAQREYRCSQAKTNSCRKTKKETVKATKLDPGKNH